MTLLRSSIRSNVSLQGLRFASSLPVLCRPYGTILELPFYAGVPLHYIPACNLTSRCDSSFVLFYKTFWEAGKVTLLRSSVWKIHFIQGLRPSGYIPACILSSLRDYSFVLLYKTFWAAPRDNK